MDAVAKANSLREFKDRFSLDEVLADAVLQAFQSSATNPYQFIARLLRDTPLPDSPIDGDTHEESIRQVDVESNERAAEADILGLTAESMLWVRPAGDRLTPPERLSILLRSSAPFTDNQFPPSPESIAHDGGATGWSVDQDAPWRRAGEALAPVSLFGELPSPFDVVQGRLGDCYLLCSLSVLAERPERVMRLFETTRVQASGCYACRLYLHGENRRVVVDDHLPWDASRSEPLFARSRAGEIWPMIFEKAFAKAHHTYQAIEAGSSAQVLETLTGAPSLRLDMRGSASLDELWQQLMEAERAGHVIAVEIGDHPQDLQRIVGIVERHAYSVLDVRRAEDARLLKLRNPWAQLEWRGDWSDGSERWTPELKTKLGWSAEDDGTFWMSIEDAARIFDRVVFNQVEDTMVYSHSDRLRFAARGGAVALALRLGGDAESSSMLTVHQEDARAFKSTGGDTGSASYAAVRFRLVDFGKVDDEDSPSAKYLGSSDFVRGQRVAREFKELGADALHLLLVEGSGPSAGVSEGSFVASAWGNVACRFERVDAARAERLLLRAYAQWTMAEGERALFNAEGEHLPVVCPVLRTWSSNDEGVLCLVYANPKNSGGRAEPPSGSHRETLHSYVDVILTFRQEEAAFNVGGMEVLATRSFGAKLVLDLGQEGHAFRLPDPLPDTELVGASGQAAGGEQQQTTVKVSVQLAPGKARIVIVRRQANAGRYSYALQRSYRVVKHGRR